MQQDKPEKKRKTRKEDTMGNIPQTLKGFRDILPVEYKKRQYVLDKVVEVFERFGFEPIQTPTLEYAALILGKYGEEADKLVYSFKDLGGRDVALPYDQTVPTARILAQYQQELPRYFRRYSIKNVFRADKPQKGRYREFTQCDIDIFGSTSPLADAEIVACTYLSYQNIGFKNIKLLINDRRVLIKTLESFTTDEVDVFSLIQTIDKLDKKPEKQVIAELVKKGLSIEKANQAMAAIKTATPSKNLKEIMKAAENLGVPQNSLVFSPTLARGLDYYTGMILEIKSEDYPAGSLGGGGRYDNLIKDLGGPNTPAVGVAFGFARTVEVADELGLIPDLNIAAKVLVTVFDESTLPTSLDIAQKLRRADIDTELYPALDNLGKQFKEADKKNIPLVIIAGPEEVEQEEVTIKNMKTGKQRKYPLSQLVSGIREMMGV